MDMQEDMILEEAKRVYDLDVRLLNFSVGIIRLLDSISTSKAGNHVSGQLLRSGTSPYANHGEAQSAESSRDIVHKMSVCLKELRETQRWLKLIKATQLTEELVKLEMLLEESDQLIRIFVASIQTAKSRK